MSTVFSRLKNFFYLAKAYILHYVFDVADFSVVTSRLLIGAAINSADDVKALVAAGCTHIIDCRDDFDDAPLLSSHPQIMYCWNGTPDDGQQKPDSWFMKSFQFGLQALSLPKTKICVHCSAGINRGPSTCYLLLRATGIAPDICEQAIRAARPQVGLAYKAQADDFLKRVIFK
jgi:hypothetical protein